MAKALDETLEERLARLQGMLERTREAGMDGAMLAQRVEDDLNRIMISAWMTCSDLVQRHEQRSQERMPKATLAAMEYAASADEGQAFLTCWLEGDFEAIRREWPDAPASIYDMPGQPV